MNATQKTQAGRNKLNSLVTAIALSSVTFFFAANAFAQSNMSKEQKARKYRVTQISQQDVELGDTRLNTILQNDKLPRLLSDPEFRKSMADKDYKNVLENEAFQELVKSEDFVWSFLYRQNHGNGYFTDYYVQGYCNGRYNIHSYCTTYP